MQSKSISRILMVAATIAIGCGLLASTASATAQSENKPCSNRTLFGNYGYAAEGVLLPAPGVSLQFRGVGMTHFDGRGNLTWVEHTVVNGTPLQPGWTEASGNYTVNPDCTGTAVVNTPNSPVPLDLAFVVVRQGKEIHSVLDSNAITTVFIKVE
jgi:hypothetical protein